MKTGYYANARGKSSGVHLVTLRTTRGARSARWLPICTYQPARSMRFQQMASACFLPYVDCAKCLDRAERRMVASGVAGQGRPRWHR